jgi:hypothetical protein
MKNLRFFAYGFLILSPLIFGASYYRGYERGVEDKSALTERAMQAESASTTAQNSADDLQSVSSEQHATIIKLKRKIRELENRRPRVVIRYVPAPTADDSVPTANDSNSSKEECRSGYRQGYQWGITHQGTLKDADAPQGSSDSYRHGFSAGVTSGKVASFSIDVFCHT